MTQRLRYKQNKLQGDRLQRLTAIGFVFRRKLLLETTDADCEAVLAELASKKYPKRAKVARVAYQHPTYVKVADQVATATTLQVDDRVKHLLGDYYATIVGFTKTKVRIQRDDREKSQLCLPHDLQYQGSCDRSE